MERKAKDNETASDTLRKELAHARIVGSGIFSIDWNAANHPAIAVHDAEAKIKTLAADIAIVPYIVTTEKLKEIRADSENLVNKVMKSYETKRFSLRASRQRQARAQRPGASDQRLFGK